MTTESFLLKKNLSSAALLGIILLLGTTLRFYDLGTESYWVDEMYTVFEGQQSISQILASGRFDQPPAFYIPFHFWVHIFGVTEVSTRVFSALAGIGSIVFIYLIGKKLFGKEVGLLSAFILSVSSFQIHYSQETRFYTFFEFTTLLSFLSFILALSKNRIIDFVFYYVASILMIYSHTYGVFILAAQNLFFILQLKKYSHVIPKWFICQALLLFAILPYTYILFYSGGGMSEAVSTNITGVLVPSLVEPLNTVYRFILPGRGGRSWTIVLVNYGVAGALFMAGAFYYAIRQGKRKMVVAARGLLASLQEVPDVNSKLLLTGCWLLCPIIVPLIFSLVVAPIYRDRYAICAAPALYLLLALVLFSARKVIPLLLSLGALMVMIVPGLIYYYVNVDHQQWREAAAFVEDNSSQDDVIVFAGGIGTGIEQKSFDWYYRATMQSCSMSNDLFDSAAKAEALMQCISGYDRFWVIVRNSTEPSNPVDSYRSFFLNLDQTDIPLRDEQHYVDISVYLFEIVK